MAKYMHADVLDNGLSLPQTRAAAGDTITLHVIKAYSAGDSYATVTGNSVGSVALSAGDFTLAAHSTTGRKNTLSSKSITSASSNSGATPDLHLAVVNTTSTKVYLVTDETSDQVITSGNPITTPSVYWAITQPT